jgi:PAS domain S-box-containing protein
LTAARAGSTLNVVTALESFDYDVEEALENIKVPSYILDDMGIIRWVNPAAIELVGDVRGKLFTSVVAPEEKSRARDEFAKKLLGKVKTTEADVIVLDENGDRLLVELNSVRLVRGGTVVGMFGQVKEQVDIQPSSAHHALTPRQAEVLRLLEHGRSTDQIAEELHLSRETVRNHIRHILQALGVHSRLEAVAVARHEHLAGIDA